MYTHSNSRKASMLKYARVAVISFVIGCVCGIVLLYILYRGKPEKVIINGGKVEYVEKTSYAVITNTGYCCDAYNSLLGDYNAFTTAPPVFISADDKKIYFSIVKNRYSLSYAIQSKKLLSIAPMIGASLNYDFTLSPALGVSASYDVWSLSLIGTARNVSLLASWGFDIK